MDRPLDIRLIVSLADDVVEQVAPDERRLFSSISEAYEKRPEQILKKQRAKDDLSLGPAGSVIALLTPTIFLILHQTFVLMSVDATEKGLWSFLRRLSKKVFKGFPSRKQNNKPSLPNFSSEELERIHEIIVKAARENKFTDTKAKQFADIVVGQLATRQTLEEKI